MDNLIVEIAETEQGEPTKRLDRVGPKLACVDDYYFRCLRREVRNANRILPRRVLHVDAVRDALILEATSEYSLSGFQHYTCWEILLENPWIGAVYEMAQLSGPDDTLETAAEEAVAATVTDLLRQRYPALLEELG